MTKRKKPEDLLKTGRPTLYNEEIAERICRLVATHPVGLEDICKQYPELPHQDTIRLWTIKYPAFFGMYARAKVNQAECLAETILHIADNCGKNWGQARLQIDSRKWLASKLLPKIYGDKIALYQDKMIDEQSRKELMEVQASLELEHKKDY